MSARDTTLPPPQQARPAPPRGVSSRAAWLTIAAQMISADFLKLRKKWGTVIWALLLAIAPLVIYFIVAGIQHSSNPAQNLPAGGVHGYMNAMRLVGAVFGPLAAILIGAEAGAGDLAAGVFRDLVATGRSRLALFATRVPAAVALSWIVTAAAYAVLVIGIYALAAGSPTPSASEMLEGFGFSLLSTGVICAIAVGLGAVTASRPATLTALIGWQLIASPILANISSLGNSRKLILSQATFQFSPIKLTGGHGAQVVNIATGTALAVLAVWLIVFLALGAWRTRTMDA
jgi:ABC-type transport system involved in multi-copper enzyme maturation permease subunit